MFSGIANEPVAEKRQLNVTYNEKPKAINTTFTARTVPLNDITFNKDSPNNPTSIENHVNETFNKDSSVFPPPVSNQINRTFNQDLPVHRTSAPDANQTFEIKDALDKIPEKGPSSAESVTSSNFKAISKGKGLRHNY